MDKCVVFLSRNENYLQSAIKIKNKANLQVDIKWIEDMSIVKNKKEIDNSVIYFLCNTLLINDILTMSKDVNCYIVNKEFFKKNYTKLEIQQTLNNNGIKIPKIFDYLELDKIKLPVFCKENIHAGIVFKAYTYNTLMKFFEKFPHSNYYIEESINEHIEKKYYYIRGNIYCKENVSVDCNTKEICEKISNILNLDVFSVDILEQNDKKIIIDVNPAPGFYLLDEAREKLIEQLEKEGKK